MTFSDGEVFDPTYFYKGDFPVIDSRIFTSDSLKSALGYADSSGKNGLLLRMQVPRFMLYEPSTPNGEKDKSFPYGLVYFRDVVPNDLLFVNGVASISHRPHEERDERLKTVTFEHLEDSDPGVKHVPFSREKRISSDGHFLPTAYWSDSICSISSHPKFQMLLSKLEKRDLEDFLSSFSTLSNQTDLTIDALQREQSKIERAKHILAKLPVKSPEESCEESDFYLSLVKESVHHCFNPRNMWLIHEIGEMVRSQAEARFLSTHKAIHGICAEDTPESTLMKGVLREAQEM